MAEFIGGLAIPTTIVEQEPAVKLFDVYECTSLALDTFRALGMIVDRGAADDYINRKFYNLNQALATEHTPGDLALYPFISVELYDDFVFDALVGAFNVKQEVDACIEEKLWRKYNIKDLNKRTLTQPQASRDVAKIGGNVYGQALAMTLGSKNAAEPGLDLTAIRDRRRAAAKLIDTYDLEHQNSTTFLVNPADYLMINAQLREEGKPPLDTSGTATSFIQFETRKTGGSPRTPRARNINGQVLFSGLSARSNDGVRFALGQKSES